MPKATVRGESFFIALSTMLIILIGIGGYWSYSNITDTRRELEETKNASQKLSENLVQAQNENTDLVYRLQLETERNNSFANQINEIAGTVGVLDKLSKTDEELLQKYSKVYFLNEHYVPPKLTDIDKKYVYEKDRTLMIHSDVWPKLQSLLGATETDGSPLLISSSFRSFGEQSGLKSSYNLTYGAGTANQFSADQGYSEHQLGTTVDFTTEKIDGSFSLFKTTDAYKWLLRNAYKYGFILSYPEDNGYYQFEPWHWRYVGTALAKTLQEEGKYFYDLDQREIDKYLVNIFD
ncbi:MAG: hypothetical protein A3E93_01415 [Candidatus Zambryskibacteria bacterium RIFCSPHIGHO2_12_FULL_43_12b]|uniref:D-alanyl-D-alanine carboxypeptidase-like core domain-containing protein n=1 Tax=Candidatus Zambryskibacteria bacterium RIFCSPLOWO2_01_FULL_43_17 TaxID=1802760 RepID=A0A1G2U601_9BACT|nr:MAG: hypothetical protein A3E93_01415 [Candidatus Zambryskibacteria bacterium RIFCSPHIGHO2_12_FULL_43_12b]OHB04917.1 MAG: hypothetical protein A2920_02675 [Candidatus Zambryskibacteria bacterium RIFCSPLOWO2_01_FULL_43_17]